MNWAYNGLVHTEHETFGDYTHFKCGWIFVKTGMDARALLHGSRTHEMTPTDEPATCLWCITETERNNDEENRYRRV